LLSHATGFHGYCYLPMADAVDSAFTSYALFFRGHGDTPLPVDWVVVWDRYGDDALAAGRAVAPDCGLVAFGHSMGGAALLMAAHRDPQLFDVLVLFEPVVFPTDIDRSGQEPSMMVEGARRRRATFGSFEEAVENFGSKPPMIAFDRDVLRLYVAHGFRPSPEGVRLKCDPEHEARTYENGAVHRTWDLLPEIETRVVVIAGVVEEQGPSAVAGSVAERLPHATYIELPDSDHFGPFVQPARFARIVADATP
jgi:pimeloyl-ACP methyl ester carboxylesterase